MLHKQSRKGFTIIELLIVLAIIGILAVIILPQLSAAREKAVDVKVKSEVATIRNQASNFYDIGNTYTSMCDLGTDIADTLDVASQSVADPFIVGGLGDRECVSNDTTWAVWVNLRHASTSAFCIDSIGMSRVVSAQDSTAVDLLACPP